MGNAATTTQADGLPLAFRGAMRRLASAVGVVVGQGADGPVGMAATSITSLTMEPPAILLCVNRAAGLHVCLAVGAPLSISILSRDQKEVSMAFGGSMPRDQRFRIGLWQPDINGLPALAGAQANLACHIEQLVPYGTHSVVIARVGAVGLSDAVAPLIYQDGAYL